MRTFELAGARVELHDSGLTVSCYGERRVPAWPQDDPEYSERAVGLGYGDDLAKMSREHELTHHLLASLLGLPTSPTLAGVASGEHWPVWRLEESAVLALQAYARAAGVDLEARFIELATVKS